MDFEKICLNRFSVRSFADKPVDRETIAKITALARIAPSARNRQPYEIFIADSDESVAKITDANAMTFGAKLVFVVCSDSNGYWCNRFSGRDFTLQDIGIVATTIMYACEEYGLGSVYVCAFDPSKVKKNLSLPDNLLPECLIVAGYKGENAKPSAMHAERKSADKLFHFIGETD